MTDAEYTNARIGDMVRVSRSIRSGIMVIPVGTLAKITFKRTGFDLEGERCDACGVQVLIRHVSARDVSTISEPWT